MTDLLLAKQQYYSGIMAWKRHGNHKNIKHRYSGFSHISRKEAKHKIGKKSTEITIPVPNSSYF